MYSLGMGIPFLLLALVYARAGRTLGILRHHGPAIERAGGALLVAVGVLLVTGVWQSLFTPWARLFVRNHWLV